jgi:hypothetical protein
MALFDQSVRGRPRSLSGSVDGGRTSLCQLGFVIADTGEHNRLYGIDHSKPIWDGDSEKIREWFRLPHRQAWWKDCDAQYAQLQRWVRSPAALEKLHRAEISCGNFEMERELSTAQRCLLEARSTKWEPVYRDRLFQTAYWESPIYRLY